MAQKTINQVVDAWSEAIERLSDHAPPDVVAQLHRATGDLIEAMATAAQSQAAHAALMVLNKLNALEVGQASDHASIEALDARTERRRAPREESH